VREITGCADSRGYIAEYSKELAAKSYRLTGAATGREDHVLLLDGSSEIGHRLHHDQVAIGAPPILPLPTHPGHPE
jgi:hypothetical protein